MTYTINSLSCSLLICKAVRKKNTCLPKVIVDILQVDSHKVLRRLPGLHSVLSQRELLLFLFKIITFPISQPDGLGFSAVENKIFRTYTQTAVGREGRASALAMLLEQGERKGRCVEKQKSKLLPQTLPHSARPHSRRLAGLFDEVPQGRRMVLELN